MRALLVGSLVVTSACRTAEPAAPAVKFSRVEPPLEKTVSVQVLLQAARAPSTMPHVRIRRLGRTSLVLQPSGPSPAHELSSCEDFELPMLTKERDQVQVAVKSGGTMLAVWVQVAHLATLVTSPTEVRTTVGEPPNGVTLRPGAPVYEREARGADSQIEMDHLAERLTGWVPTSSLGIMYMPESAVPAPERKVSITNGHPLRARADLTAPPTFSNAFGGPYDLVGEANGFAELVYRSTFVEARGFVPSSVLHQSSVTGMCESQRSSFMVGELTFPRIYQGPLEVPIGTCLRSGRHGPIVGLQIASGTHEVSIEAEGWGRIRIDDEWGGHVVGLPVTRKNDGSYAVAAGSCECLRAGVFRTSC